MRSSTLNASKASRASLACLTLTSKICAKLIHVLRVSNNNQCPHNRFITQFSQHSQVHTSHLDAQNLRFKNVQQGKSQRRKEKIEDAMHCQKSQGARRGE
jgi:hypothetical protein